MTLVLLQQFLAQSASHRHMVAPVHLSMRRDNKQGSRRLVRLALADLKGRVPQTRKGSEDAPGAIKSG